MSTSPATAQDLIQALPPDELLTTSTVDNPEAQAMLERAAELIHSVACTGARARADRSWDIDWYRQDLMLCGTLYVTDDGEPDKTSPLILVNRLSCKGVYGPELAGLARRVLADTLVYEAMQAAAANH